MLQTIRKKLMAVSVVVLLLTAGGAGAGIWLLGQLGSAYDAADNANAILHHHMQADMVHDALRADVLSALVGQDGGYGIDIAAVRKTTAEHVAAFQAAIDKNRGLASTPELQSVINAVVAPLEAYAAAAGDIVERVAQGERVSQARLDDFLRQFDTLADRMEAASDMIDKVVASQGEEADAIQASGNSILWLVMAAGVLVCLGMAVFVALFVSRPIRVLSDNMRALAKGDLGVRLEAADRTDEVGEIARAVRDFQTVLAQKAQSDAQAAERHQRAERESADRQLAIDSAKAEDLRAFVTQVEAGFTRLAAGDLTVRMDQVVAPEFESIRAQFNQAVSQLEDTIGQVVGAVGAMRSGLSEITVATGDLSQRTEQQAASLEETVAALGQVTRGVGETAARADAVRQAAANACREAEKGGEIVGRAVSAMSEIEESSAKIGNIIGVIDEIAFQTNLLALNAGVEAARAGEAGRGFAVVAQEVRGLAQRSAEAAKEIKALISASSAQVEGGVELVTASGQSLEAIVAQVGGVAQTIADMADAARDQATSLREVSVAADQMDKVTQQNAAMVEETTAAAQTLSGETEQVARLVGGFRTGGQPAPAQRIVAPAPAAARPAARPAAPARPVPQMRSVGLGGVAPKATADADGWEEF